MELNKKLKMNIILLHAQGRKDSNNYKVGKWKKNDQVLNKNILT